ncbi:hypothetical protein TanjilG_01410 [Lupinus angustifolius]|uniref:origin recognition complex subunit 3-like n=1 Tax=Lupinus angustifolius TaxID=3871 RepID=UPI00090D2696|nr:PREDICTED: origin recognition complex subunit 3-like [Lupinus angustifolius]OIV90214.1 hypothetical protein TanjilG_01410 [Lupinus angustifolius]
MAFLSYENKRGSGKKLKVHFELPKDEDYHIPHKKDSSSSISSDSSLDSNDDDSENDDHHNIDNFDSKNDMNGYNNSNAWSYNGESITHSPPPMQMMCSSGYDPNRIPSSIFSSPNHMEWSVQSNESLFSIHLGNASFSRDHVFSVNNKSGEFPWTNDLISMPNPMMLPSVQEVDHDNKQVKRHSISSDTSEETANLIMENEHKKVESPVHAKIPTVDQTPKDHSKEVIQAIVLSDEAKNYHSVSYRSMESDRSFQFPILTMDGRMNSSSILESEKEEKNEHQQQQQHQEKQVELSKPETEKEPAKKGGKSWCFCFSCLPCCFR